MTPEQRDARARRLVSAARALLALQVGLYVGSRRIENVLTWLGPEFRMKHRIFAEFTNAVPLDIPVGTARLLWAPEAMLKTDERLATVETQFRTKLLAECVEIIKQYG
ncbi:MAG: hypothetical protein ABW069_17335 [Duganella sp.]